MFTKKPPSLIKKVNLAIIAGQLVVGGAERQLYLWLSNLDRSRFNTIVLTLHPGYDDFWEKPIEDLGIKLYRIPQTKIRIFRLLKIIRVLKEFRPDLIHGWHLFASTYAGMAAKFLKTKSIGGVRNTYKTFSDHKKEVAISLRTVNAIITNSTGTAKSLKNRIRKDHPYVFTVHNAIEDSFFDRELSRDYFVRSFAIPSSAIWVVSIGRMEPLKHFDRLIDLMAELRSENRKIHLILIGDGPERSFIENRVKDLGISDEVTFTGELPQASRYLKAMDIFTFTSVDEGMPNVLMEAAAAGLPIVAWNLPFNQEILDNGRTALLVEADDQNAMKKAMLDLINSSALRKTIGNSAREHMLSNFNIDVYVRKMTQVYESMLKDCIDPGDLS